MRPKERRETGEHDLFRSRLDQIIDLEHALVRLARAIDWRFLEEKFGAAYSDKPGHPPLPTRLMAGLAILKHSYDLSDEALCERWVENPYFQYFCGEEFFQHRRVFDRSSLTRWRQRMGVQKLVALIKHQRYAHAKQFKRANRALRKLRTYLGRVIRDIRRNTVGNERMHDAFLRPLYLAERVLLQDRRQRGHKVYSLHAPEVECIGKGKAHRPYEFGVKVSVATPVKHSAGGQFVTHVAALPGNPYDGHTLAKVIPAIEALVGNVLDRIVADAGYRGHNAPPDYKFKVYTAGQKRRVTEQIKRDFKRRAAIEPVIGHLKDDHRMGRNYLAHSSGDAINAVLAAAAYNFRRLIAWLRLLLLRILLFFSPVAQLKSA
jgi:IS5 family transposase